MIPHEIKLSDLASNCIFYFAPADGKESVDYRDNLNFSGNFLVDGFWGLDRRFESFNFANVAK